MWNAIQVNPFAAELFGTDAEVQMFSSTICLPSVNEISIQLKR